MRICLLEDSYHSPVQVGDEYDDSEYEYDDDSAIEESPKHGDGGGVSGVLFSVLAWIKKSLSSKSDRQLDTSPTPDAGSTGEGEAESSAQADSHDFEDAACDPRPFLTWQHEVVSVQLTKEDAVSEVIRLAREGFDVFFNQCAGAWDESYTGIEVVQALERLDVPFTGATSEFYEPSREAMKRVCAALGITSPAYVIARTDADVDRAGEMLRFPMIVKHYSSYSSTDLTPESRVVTVEALREKSRYMIDRYGAALIEEFIEGREFSVLVAENPDNLQEPITFTPVEILFPEGESFKHYELKWVTYQGMEDVPVTDPELDARLRRISTDFFIGMRGASFGRCDLRMGEDGELYMLEINPNCGVFYPATDPGSADMSLLHDPAGHQGFTDLLLKSALARHARRQRGWEVRWSPERGYGIHAMRDFPAGEVVIRYEDTPHTLVTRSYVEAHWDERQKAWFRAYAWPLTDEVWATWSEEPEEWKPVSHACEPNTWLEGLDLVARRDIESGEEITADYATFYNEQMSPFECTCGGNPCRGVIRGDDFLRPFVARYGGHVSDYVRRRRREAGLDD